MGGALTFSGVRAYRLGVTEAHVAFATGYYLDHSLPFAVGFGGMLAMGRHVGSLATLHMRLSEANRRVTELEAARRITLEERFRCTFRHVYGNAPEYTESCAESVTTESGEDDDAGESHHASKVSHHTTKIFAGRAENEAESHVAESRKDGHNAGAPDRARSV